LPDNFTRLFSSTACVTRSGTDTLAPLVALPDTADFAKVGVEKAARKKITTRHDRRRTFVRIDFPLRDKSRVPAAVGARAHGYTAFKLEFLFTAVAYLKCSVL